MKLRSVIFWTLLLVVGLSLSSCKTETPVNELPVDQTDTEDADTGAGEETEQPETREVTLYLPNETADGFLTSSMILEDTAEAIIAQLVAEQALPEGVQVLDFNEEQHILNLSQEYEDALQSTGTAGERLYIGAVVNTFLEHYGMEEIMLYVEGEVIETGHSTFDAPLGFLE